MTRTFPALLAILLASCAAAGAPTATATATAPPTATAAPPATATPTAVPPELLRAKRPANGEWLGIYLNPGATSAKAAKLGWAYSEVGEADYRGQPAVRSVSRLELRATVGGNTVRRTVEDLRWYERRDGGLLLGIDARRSGDGGERRFTGACTAERCELHVTEGGAVQTRTMPHPGEKLEDADPIRLAAARRGVVDSSYLDLDEMRVKRSKNRFLGEDALLVGGVPVRVARVGSVEEGETLESVSALSVADGSVLELSLGAAMVARPEPEDQARRIEGTADVFALTKVMLPAPLPKDATRVTLVVEGLPKEFWKEDGRQKFTPLGKDRVKVEILVKRPARTAALPIQRARFEKELSATEAIDADAEPIRQLARKLVPEPTDSFAAAAAILGYVHGAVQKTYGQSSDRASRVLEQRRGDCTEHSILFAAIARAAGLPAKTVHGLVAADVDGTAALFWHEWVAVWVGEWVQVDPTFGQTVADATHFALGFEGETSTVALLGRLKVIEASAR